MNYNIKSTWIFNSEIILKGVSFCRANLLFNARAVRHRLVKLTHTSIWGVFRARGFLVGGIFYTFDWHQPRVSGTEEDIFMLINVNVFNIMYEWLAHGIYIMRSCNSRHFIASSVCIWESNNKLFICISSVESTRRNVFSYHPF